MITAVPAGVNKHGAFKVNLFPRRPKSWRLAKRGGSVAGAALRGEWALQNPEEQVNIRNQAMNILYSHTISRHAILTPLPHTAQYYYYSRTVTEQGACELC